MRLRVLHILTLFVCTLSLMAQTERSVSVEGLDTPKVPFLKSIGVGVDVFGAGYRLLGSEGDFQAYVLANIKGTFVPTVEVGYGNADKYNADTYVGYKSNGFFGRIGCDYNVLKKKMDDYRLMVGLRYGLSHFNYDTTMPTDTLHREFTTLSETCTVHWLELAFGVDVRVAGPLHMGWSVRYRRRMGCSDYVNAPLYAPGFGNASGTSTFMALYTIGLEF